MSQMGHSRPSWSTLRAIVRPQCPESGSSAALNLLRVDRFALHLIHATRGGGFPTGEVGELHEMSALRFATGANSF
jgi:hypothetical protein